MLAWLLKRERHPPLILSLCGPAIWTVMGQFSACVHLRGVYASPMCVDDSQVDGYLASRQLPKVTEAQAGDLEGDIQSGELQEALRQCHTVKIRIQTVSRLISFRPTRPHLCLAY
ncbi:hypothetical protein NDU88_003137 [Pleurodeles waltl]|uniref:Uncharacterized protein n=1 Tax=Pleurodeles waltl TaxID=8319 RepID=A0AAV7UZS4_PLEWA|nr:hypothetical protein NDU88_003137 [Pleurodeles waltl]